MGSQQTCNVDLTLTYVKTTLQHRLTQYQCYIEVILSKLIQH